MFKSGILIIQRHMMKLRARKDIVSVVLCVMTTFLQADSQEIALMADKVSVPKDGSVELTCSIQNLKVPVNWHLNNVSQSLFIGNHSNMCEKIPNPFPAPYTGNCVNSTVYKLTINLVTSNMSGNRWQCSANMNNETTVKSNKVILQITVPITGVTMTTPNTTHVRVNDGMKAQFVCTTTSGLPAARVIWYKDNRSPGNTGDDSEISSSISVEYRNNTGDKTVSTTSTLLLTADKADNGIAVYCKAGNGEEDLVSTRKPILNVQFAPESNPVIQGFTSPAFYYMIRNSPTTQQLTCTLTGGNPPANLSWSCYDSPHTETTEGNTVTRTVTWMAGTKVNSVCICTASHVVGWTGSASVNVLVLNPPSAPQCSVGTSTVTSGIIKVIQGTTLTINCSSIGNPPPEFNWTIPNIGTRAGQQLTVNNIQTESTYSFTATNTMTPSLGQQERGSSSTNFSTEMLYPPVVLPLNNKTVIEDTTVTIECNVTPGNPNETTFQWTKNQIQVMSQQQLRFEKITRHQSGVYTCTASNTMRPSGCDPRTEAVHRDVYIDVQYRSEVKDIHVKTFEGQTVVTINQTSRFNITCDVDSNPKSDIALIKDGIVVKEALHETNLYYAYQSSDCERDIGVYTCTGRNKHNNESSSKNLTLYVQCKPRPARNFILDVNVTTSTGVRATLVFKVAAYPRPTASDYTWEKLEDGSWTEVSNNSKVEYVVSNAGLQSTLSFKEVVENDFSSYRVNASNKLGTIFHIFHLQAQERPHQPLGLMYNFVKDSNHVTLTWTPGFDGGLQQTFTIEYKKASSFEWLPEIVELGRFNHTLTNLEYGTQYEGRIYAVNNIGASNYSTTIRFVTPREKETKNIATLIGGAVGGLSFAAMIVVAVAVVCILRRKKAHSEAEHLSLTATSAIKRENLVADEGIDDDLPDEIENPLYVAGGTVTKAVVDPNCLYSQPHKSARQNTTQGTSDVYAVVQKKDKKKKQKLTTKADRMNKDIYENAEKGAFDNKTFDAAETTDTNNKKINQKHLNKDGLVYADLVFPNPPKGQKRFVIHGEDDMTVYAELDPTKRVDPLPDSDEEKDQNK